MTIRSNVYDGQGNLVEQIVDNDDGTGEFICYENGEVVEIKELVNLPLPEGEDSKTVLEEAASTLEANGISPEVIAIIRALTQIV